MMCSPPSSTFTSQPMYDLLSFFNPSINFDSSEGTAGCTGILKTGLDIISNGLKMSRDSDLNLVSKIVAVLVMNESMSWPDIRPIDPAGMPSTLIR
ncbi:hypothetical protein OGAPHI_005641 [Ogataea philodendri]|uniref:Uncharacterized protein n=1 Tax=Ogataea philodendri TaxID=1378263 RepID=A0A9P8T1Q6_9ASCO|nr:uncharacterized protein OGAPHI_005641 [Ogataea philodendri]KAH3662389.1 hypothetical protein OGAPHI_005641 [Ogataea philodendri]